MKFPHFLRRTVLCLAAGGAMFLTGWTASAATLEPDALPNLDRRLETANPPGFIGVAGARPERAAAEANLRARLPELQLERHEIVGSPKWISARDGFLTGRDGVGRGADANFVAAAAGLRADDPHHVVKRFINEHSALFGHDASALERAAVKRDYVTAHSGMRTTVWQQEHEGIEVFEAVFLAHTTKDGELVNVSSQFVPDAAQAAARGRTNRAAGAGAALDVPTISAAQALRLASLHLGDEEALAADTTALDEPQGRRAGRNFAAARSRVTRTFASAGCR